MQEWSGQKNLLNTFYEAIVEQELVKFVCFSGVCTLQQRCLRDWYIFPLLGLEKQPRRHQRTSTHSVILLCHH